MLENHTSFIELAAAVYLLSVNFCIWCWSCLFISKQVTGKNMYVTMSPSKKKTEKH